MKPIRVMIVDDQILFRRGMASIMSAREGIDVIGEAGDGHEALEEARRTVPDIVLMDIDLPRCNGVEATRLIKQEMPFIKIVMLTISDNEKDLFDAIKAGAEGYLLKDLEPNELFSLLEGAMKGEAAISRAMAAKILVEFGRHDTKEEAASLRPGGLTAREKDVLELVAIGASNRDIASTLGIAENTVKNHLRNILDKLHLANRVQAAAFALREGLAHIPPRGG